MERFVTLGGGTSKGTDGFRRSAAALGTAKPPAFRHLHYPSTSEICRAKDRRARYGIEKRPGAEIFSATAAEDCRCRCREDKLCEIADLRIVRPDSFPER